MSRHFRVLALTVASALGTNAIACNPPAAPACSVTASPGRIAASFPVLNPPFVWRWLRPQTADHALEYRWQVEFGTCGADGKFVIGEYAYGAQLFKFPGSTPKSGPLSALLAQSQHTFVRREASGGRVVYSMVPRAQVESEVIGTTVKLLVTGPEPVAQLLANLPRHALLTVNTLDRGGSYSCYAEVQYAQ